jgi:hypothetical protein
LAFRLKTDKGRLLILRLRKPGLFLPEAKEILLAHQDLEDAGFRVNYHTGQMRAPGGHVLTMTKSGAVWQIPVTSPSTRATKRMHTALTATTSAPATTTSSSTTRSVERMHEVLCCAGTTATLRYYDYYKGTGFGNASKTDIRNFKCPIKPLMHGEATPKRRAAVRRAALTQWRYARTRRTWMMQIVSVHAVQTSRRNASSGPLDHGMSSADNHSNPLPVDDRWILFTERQRAKT